MARQKTPSASAKPELDSVAKYEAELASPPKPKVRLPRLGCFWIFGIFLFFSVGLATGYYHSVGEEPASFEIPEGRVTVSDPECMLLEEDEQRLESLAKEISQQADCGVALMFIDEQFASPAAVFDLIAAEWAPGKGVLLVQDVRGTSIRFGLIGEGWRVADWDYDKVQKEVGTFRIQERGAKAIALLERLKHSLESAAKVPAGTGNADGQSEQTTAQTQAKNPANMTDEELEKQMAAEDAAAEALLDAELDDEDYYDDEESVGMRAYAEKNKGKKIKGILYSSMTDRGGDGSAKNYALIFLAIFGAIAAGSIIIGKKQRKKDLTDGPKVLAKFKKQSNSRLKLVDINEFDDSGILHNKYLRITAAVLGILFGLGFVSSTLSEPPKRDVARIANSNIPAAPLDGWRIVDKAGVFGQDGTAKVAAAIRHLEAQTGGEMMVLTVPTIGLTSIEDFSIETASQWKIGKAGKDNGALLVFAINDRQNRLEIGYGWEGPINDARAGDLLRKIVPELREEKYAEAAIKVVQGVEFFVTGVHPDSLTVEPGQQSEQKTTYVPQVREYENIVYEKPEHDPRVLDPADSMWGAIGVFGCLIAILLAYWGRIVGTSAPHLFIYDPTEVRSYSSSGSSSSGSSHSYSSSSSSSSGGGGGSFGGGGASGRW